MSRHHHRVNVSAQLAVAFFREAEEWRAKGDLENEQKALEAGYALLEREGIGSPEEARQRASERVPYTAAEEAQAATDATAAATKAAADAEAAVSRAALVTKLKAGSATDLETQQALAQLLGGG